ncbi:MAG: DMT family transporter [Bacteroidales bacterium]
MAKITTAKSYNLGILFAILSSLGFGIMPFLVKDAMKEGLCTFSILFYRFALASIALFIVIKIKGLSLRINKRQLIEAILLAGLGCLITSFFLFLSYNYISAGLATSLHFTYGAFVCIIMAIFFREQLNIIKAISIFLSLIGVFLLIRGEQLKIDLYGSFLALITGLTYAIYLVGLNKCSINKKPTLVLIFYVVTFSTILMIPTGISTHQFQWIQNTKELYDLVSLALISTIFSLILILEAIKRIGATKAAILSTMEPISCLIFGLLFYHEVITLSIALGCSLIVLSVILISKNSRLH